MYLIMYLKVMFLFLLGLLVSSSIVHAQANIEANPELTRSSVVIVTQANFSLGTDSVLNWMDNHADISGTLKKSDLPVQKILDESISQALKEKGYAFGSTGDNVILVKYHVSLESEMADTALAMRYGLAPGLRSNNVETRKYERGTLVVDLISPVLNKVVWRGAIGVFTGIEDTDKSRQARVKALMVELFSSFPSVK